MNFFCEAALLPAQTTPKKPRMGSRNRSEAGETLMEVLISIVIIGLIVGAFFSAMVTTSHATTAHRDLVSADAMLRDSAEATKEAVRRDCSAGSTYSVTYSAVVPQRPGFTPPPDVPPGHPCPPVTGSLDAQVPKVTLTVGMPNSQTKSLELMVRSP